LRNEMLAAACQTDWRKAIQTRWFALTLFDGYEVSRNLSRRR